MLDTNVVLDWLVFAEPSVASLVDALETSQVRWLVTAEIRQELAHVLVRGLAARRGRDAGAVLAAFDRHAVVVPTAPAAAASLRCTDPDDQKFIDLAVAANAGWLVSRDRAVCKLARRAALAGVSIVTPEHWRIDA